MMTLVSWAASHTGCCNNAKGLRNNHHPEEKHQASPLGIDEAGERTFPF